MKKINLIYIIILPVFVLINFLFAPFSALACSYMYQEPEETYATNPIVFIGKIKKVTHDGDLNGTRTVTFEVLKTYKGNVSTQINMTTGANSAICGFEEETLVVGDVWVIHSQNVSSFNSLPHNNKYSSLAEAQQALDEFAEEKPTMCPMIYQPVCGQKDTGIRCVTTPCPSMEVKTYSNTCVLNAEEAEYLYDGECGTESNPVVTPDKPILNPEVEENTQEGTASTTDSDTKVEVVKKENIFKRVWNVFMNLFR